MKQIEFVSAATPSIAAAIRARHVVSIHPSANKKLVSTVVCPLHMKETRNKIMKVITVMTCRKYTDWLPRQAICKTEIKFNDC
jgi:hypothetical protein